MRYVLYHDLFLLLVRLGLNYATQGLAIERKAPVLDMFMKEKINVNKEKRYMVGQGDRSGRFWKQPIYLCSSLHNRDPRFSFGTSLYICAALFRGSPFV